MATFSDSVRPKSYDLSFLLEMKDWFNLRSIHDGAHFFDSQQFWHDRDPEVKFCIRVYPNVRGGNVAVFVVIDPVNASQRRPITDEWNLLDSEGTQIYHTRRDQPFVAPQRGFSEPAEVGFNPFISHANLEQFLNGENTVRLQLKLKVYERELHHDSCATKIESNETLQSAFLHHLQNTYKTGVGFDMKVIVDDGSDNLTEFGACRSILEIASEAMKAALNGNTSENITNSYSMSDTTPAVVQEFLSATHCGKINLEHMSCRQEIEELCVGLLKMSDKYDVQFLKPECEKRLSELISMDNFCKLLWSADAFSASVLQQYCHIYFRINREAIMNRDDWKSLKKLSPSVVAEALEAAFKPPA